MTCLHCVSSYCAGCECVEDFIGALRAENTALKAEVERLKQEVVNQMGAEMATFRWSRAWKRAAKIWRQSLNGLVCGQCGTHLAERDAAIARALEAERKLQTIRAETLEAAAKAIDDEMTYYDTHDAHEALCAVTRAVRLLALPSGKEGEER